MTHDPFFNPSLKSAAEKEKLALHAFFGILDNEDKNISTKSLIYSFHTFKDCILTPERRGQCLLHIAKRFSIFQSHKENKKITTLLEVCEQEGWALKRGDVKRFGFEKSYRTIWRDSLEGDDGMMPPLTILPQSEEKEGEIMLTANYVKLFMKLIPSPFPLRHHVKALVKNLNFPVLEALRRSTFPKKLPSLKEHDLHVALLFSLEHWVQTRGMTDKHERVLGHNLHRAHQLLADTTSPFFFTSILEDANRMPHGMNQLSMNCMTSILKHAQRFHEEFLLEEALAPLEGTFETPASSQRRPRL